MIALIGNLDIAELMVIALFSVMIFGRNLPRVAAQVVTHVTRARRALQKVWRESGIGDEIRDVQREIERTAAKMPDLNPRAAARTLTREIEASVREPIPTKQDETTDDPDANRVDEPEGESQRHPEWYPENPRPSAAVSRDIVEVEPPPEEESPPEEEPESDKKDTGPGE